MVQSNNKRKIMLAIHCTHKLTLPLTRSSVTYQVSPNCWKTSRKAGYFWNNFIGFIFPLPYFSQCLASIAKLYATPSWYAIFIAAVVSIDVLNTSLDRYFPMDSKLAKAVCLPIWCFCNYGKRTLFCPVVMLCSEHRDLYISLFPFFLLFPHTLYQVHIFQVHIVISFVLDFHFFPVQFPMNNLFNSLHGSVPQQHTHLHFIFLKAISHHLFVLHVQSRGL